MGYDKQQVDEYISKLIFECQSRSDEYLALETRYDDLHKAYLRVMSDYNSMVDLISDINPAAGVTPAVNSVGFERASDYNEVISAEMIAERLIPAEEENNNYEANPYLANVPNNGEFGKLIKQLGIPLYEPQQPQISFTVPEEPPKQYVKPRDLTEGRQITDIQYFPETQRFFEERQPIEAPRPVEHRQPIEAPRPVEHRQPIEAPRPVEHRQPIEAPRPVEHRQPVEPWQPAENTQAQTVKPSTPETTAPSPQQFNYDYEQPERKQPPSANILTVVRQMASTKSRRK
jgi:hypothetical protein